MYKLKTIKMKINFLLFVAFFTMLSTVPSYASFPVTQNQTENVSAEKTVTEKNNDEMFSPAAAASGKSQLVALLLCLFVGIIGIHRFYLGYIWQGVVQILTLGGFGIWALIDLIRIITGDLQPKDGTYSETL